MCLGKIFYRYLLVFVWMTAYCEIGVWKSPTINLWGSMCDLSFSNASFTNVGAIVFVAYIFRIGLSSWLIFPLMNMKYPSPLLWINFGWKSILLDSRMTTPAFFLGLFP